MRYVPQNYSSFFPANSGYRFGSILQQRGGIPIGFSGNVPFEVNMAAAAADPNPLPVAGAIEGLGLDPDIRGQLGPGLDPGIGTGGYAPELRDAIAAALPEDWLNTRFGNALKGLGIYILAVALLVVGLLYFVRKPAANIVKAVT